jgi:GT2 family glycosyltransferase
VTQGFEQDAARAAVDVLIPTFERAAALGVTLSSLAAQTLRPLRIVVSDQSGRAPASDALEIRAVVRVLEHRGHRVEFHRHLPRRGLAEHRDFLLAQARAPYALFLDDDVFVEPDLVERLLAALRVAGCGFVGSAVIGLSYRDDLRPHQHGLELWEGEVTPEAVGPGTPQWARHHVHSAANLLHVAQRLGVDAAHPRLYKVAWIGGCVLYDTAKLRAAGGFGFWRELPASHCGEDVLAQVRVMSRFGGAGLLPSGAFHLELPTTVPERTSNAPEVLRHLAEA